MWSRMSSRDGKLQSGTVGDLVLLMSPTFWQFDLLWTNCQWRSTHSVGVTSHATLRRNIVSIIFTASCVRPTTRCSHDAPESLLNVDDLCTDRRHRLLIKATEIKQAVGGRPPQYAPAPLLPLWAPKRLAPPTRPRLQSADRNVAVGSHGQYVPTLTAATAWRGGE